MVKTNSHILLVTSEFPPLPGGIGNHAYNLAKHLNNNKRDVSVIADNRATTAEENKFDAALNFKVYRIKKRSFRMLMYFQRLSLLFKHIKTSDTIIASGKFPLWIVAFSSFFYKKNYIAIIHGSEVNFTNVLLKKSIDKSLKRYRKIIAVSHYTKSLVSDLNLNNIAVIPNGFDASKWGSQPQTLLKLKGHPSLMTVGNVTERKGQLNVIKHLPELVKIYPNIHYHCVGFETQKEAFLEVAEQLGVSNYITFHGRAKHEDLMSFYKNSDVFVMLSSATSTGDVEGFGIAIIEANYFGLPAIGSKDCGIEDAIDDYKSGVLINYNDTKAFVDALDEVLKNKETYNVEAKNWAMKHTWEVVIKKYIKEIGE